MRIPIKKVSARGKRYAYLRGTDIALVRGFVGTAEQFDVAVAAALRSRGVDAKSSFDGYRMDAATALHRGAMSRARECHRSYSLSTSVIAEMLMRSGDQCEVTAIPFDYHAANTADAKVRPMAPSLDRINNALGYDRPNVRVVCVCVNVALNVWGLENFGRVCRAFVDKMENARVQNGKQNEQGSAITQQNQADGYQFRELGRVLRIPAQG